MRKLACTLVLLLAGAAPVDDALAAAATSTPSTRSTKAPPRKGIDRSPAKKAPDRPVKITAESLDFLPGEKKALWKGNVVAVRDDMTIRCRSLVADYDGAGNDRRIQKLTCTGDAYMRQVAKADRPEREVWGEVAVWDNDTAVLVVTGAPRAREGTSAMQGEKITFDSSADKLRVERVSMVIDTPPDKDPLARPKASPPDAGARKEPER